MQDQELYLRFTEKFAIGDECWEWNTPGDSLHYPKFKVNGKAIDAHRVSFELVNGTIPSKAYICHICDNRRCVRPDHLFIGNHVINMVDAFRKRRVVPPGAGKLNENVIPLIRQELNSGRTHGAIARDYGVSRDTISKINQGKIWGWVA